MQTLMAKLNQANKTTSGLMRKLLLIFLLLVVIFFLAWDFVIPDVVQ